MRLCPMCHVCQTRSADLSTVVSSSTLEQVRGPIGDTVKSSKCALDLLDSASTNYSTTAGCQ